MWIKIIEKNKQTYKKEKTKNNREKHLAKICRTWSRFL